MTESSLSRCASMHRASETDKMSGLLQFEDKVAKEDKLGRGVTLTTDSREYAMVFKRRAMESGWWLRVSHGRAMHICRVGRWNTEKEE